MLLFELPLVIVVGTMGMFGQRTAKGKAAKTRDRGRIGGKIARVEALREAGRDVGTLFEQCPPLFSRPISSYDGPILCR